jgi:hypothetical protein
MFGHTFRRVFKDGTSSINRYYSDHSQTTPIPMVIMRTVKMFPEMRKPQRRNTRLKSNDYS